MTEDGSIVINTKIRTDGIKAGTAEIEAGVHRAADRVNTLGSNVKKTLNTIKYEIRQVIKKIRQDGKEFPDITPHGRVIIRTS